jgi:hypothetical protein
MSGGNVPYHLRPNKFVERQLGLDLLDKLERWRSLERYVYVSMGGAFLEDLKQVHSRSGLARLYSFEGDPIVYARQMFNRPLGVIKCLRQTSEDFVTNFGEFSAKFAKASFFIWLDYTRPRERASQLSELRTLLSNLNSNDVVKITLNANLETLGIPTSGRPPKEFQPEMLEAVRTQLGEYFPSDSGVDHTHMTSSKFARILSRAVGIAAVKGVQGSQQLTAVPLAIFRYNDGHHPMLTVTVLLLDCAAEVKFAKSALAKWQFMATAWDAITEIVVPDLSIKERLFIDEHLFTSTEDEIHAKLPFKFADDEAESLEILKDYVTHYNRYPHFLRVMF